VCCIEAENTLQYNKYCTQYNKTLSLRDLGSFRFLGVVHIAARRRSFLRDELESWIVNRVDVAHSETNTSIGECFSPHQPTIIVGSTGCTDWRSPWIMYPVNLMMIRCRSGLNYRLKLRMIGMHLGIRNDSILSKFFLDFFQFYPSIPKRLIYYCQMKHFIPCTFAMRKRVSYWSSWILSWVFSWNGIAVTFVRSSTNLPVLFHYFRCKSIPGVSEKACTCGELLQDTLNLD
jgi:hypothetical protein